MPNVNLGALLFELAIVDRGGFKKQLEEAQNQVERVGLVMQKVAKDMVLQWSLAAGVVTAAVEDVAIKYDAKMREVQRTSGMTNLEIQSLSSTFLELSKTLPTADAAQNLASIAVVAGQLGLKGKDEVESFTLAVNKIATTFEDLNPEDTAQKMAQIAFAFGHPISDVERMGSVISVIAKESVATAGQLLQFTQAAAGAASNVGLTYDQVVALGGALINLGIPAAQAGTALANFFNKLGTKPEEFARTMDISVQDFKRMVEQDAVGAILKYLQAINSLGQGSTEARFMAAEALEALGIRGARAENALQKLRMNGIEPFVAMMDVANRELKEGNSLNEQFAIIASSMQSQMNQMTNEARALAIEMGSNFFPVLRMLFDMLSGIVRFFGALPAPLKNFAFALGMVVAAAGPFNLIFGNGIRLLGQMMGSMLEITTRIQRYTAVARAAAEAGHALNFSMLGYATGGMGTFATVLLAITAAIGIISWIVSMFANNTQDAEAKAAALSQTLRDKLNRELRELQGNANSSKDRIKELTTALDELDKQDRQRAYIKAVAEAGSVRGQLKTEEYPLLKTLGLGINWSGGTIGDPAMQKLADQALHFTEKTVPEMGKIIESLSVVQAKWFQEGVLTKNSDLVERSQNLLRYIDLLRQYKQAAEVVNKVETEQAGKKKVAPFSTEYNAREAEDQLKAIEKRLALSESFVQQAKAEAKANEDLKTNSDRENQVRNTVIDVERAKVLGYKQSVPVMDAYADSVAATVAQLEYMIANTKDASQKVDLLRQLVELETKAEKENAFEKDKAAKAPRLEDEADMLQSRWNWIKLQEDQVRLEVAIRKAKGGSPLFTKDEAATMADMAKEMEKLRDEAMEYLTMMSAQPVLTKEEVAEYMRIQSLLMQWVTDSGKNKQKNSFLERIKLDMMDVGVTAKSTFDTIMRGFQNMNQRLAAMAFNTRLQLKDVWQGMATDFLTMFLQEIEMALFSGIIRDVIGALFPTTATQTTTGLPSQLLSGGETSDQRLAKVVDSLIPQISQPAFSTVSAGGVQTPPTIKVVSQTPQVDVHLHGVLDGQKFLRSEQPKFNRWEQDRKLVK